MMNSWEHYTVTWALTQGPKVDWSVFSLICVVWRRRSDWYSDLSTAHARGNSFAFLLLLFLFLLFFIGGRVVVSQSSVHRRACKRATA